MVCKTHTVAFLSPLFSPHWVITFSLLRKLKTVSFYCLLSVFFSFCSAFSFSNSSVLCSEAYSLGFLCEFLSLLLLYLILLNQPIKSWTFFGSNFVVKFPPFSLVLCLFLNRSDRQYRDFMMHKCIFGDLIIWVGTWFSC